MGYVRKKICSAAGCKNYALSNSAYCQDHQKEINRNTTSKYISFYSSGIWRKARKRFLISHIWCENCLKQGKYTPSNTVHHSMGFCDWNTFIDQSKWVAWCDSCHSSYHKTINNEQLYEQNKNKWDT